MACVIDTFPDVKVTSSMIQAGLVLLFTGAVISSPLYCVLSIEPKVKVPSGPDLRLREKTDC